MAAYAALVSLLNNIHTIKNHPTLSTSLENTQIQPLLEKTGFLLDLVEGNNYGGGSKEEQDLERRIASAAHAAEDVIESHIMDQIREARSSYLLKFLLKFVSCHVIHRSEKPLDLQHINEDMDAIIKEANEFKEKHRLTEEQQPTDLARPLMQSVESCMVGLDDELNQLLDELTGHESSRRIISIVGMGGVGKTTLAKNVFENLLIKDRFQFRAWATISQHHNAHKVLSKILSALELGKMSNPTVDDLDLDLGELSDAIVDTLGLGELSKATVGELGLQLHKTLSGRRYLIILDDIWSVTAWDEVKHYFPDNKNGSRILLTTRLSNVARDCGSSLFMMSLLDKEKSWKLFHEKAFQNDDCPPELREVGEEFVKLCKGLALSIVVIGGVLLKSPRTVGYWKSVANNLKSVSNSKEKYEILDLLALSYNSLPPHLKPCFLYLGVFKDNSQIHISKIIRLWIAEGFVKSIGSRVLEEIAEGYIKDLVDRNLILVGRLSANGKLGSCGIHDILRDLCIKLAEQEEFFHVNKQEMQGTERRLVDVGRTDVKLPLIRSIIRTEGSIKPLIESRLLRVLDEAHLNSQAYYNYAHANLRYLTHDLGHAKYQQKLPSSLSLMWNLQTLIIKNDNDGYVSLIVMPVEIWKMQQLRHVECAQMYIPDPPRSNGKDELLILENLHTLKTVVNLRLCEVMCKIILNIKKLHLEYDNEMKGYDDSLIDCLCYLDRLHHLESLYLSTRMPFLSREADNKHTTSFPRWVKKLSLFQYRLEWDDMRMLGSLPQLEVLKLRDLYVHKSLNWSPVEGQFLRLKFLKIERCYLVCWDADNSHFPVLEKLVLDNMWRLEEIPLAIGDIPTLQLICVDRCTEAAAVSAVRIKEDQLDNGIHLQVQIRLFNWDMKTFNQMLEKEELTTDNIELEIL